ncbi:MAG TPA: glycerophosphodiester phosphodiesterase family protein [Jatrophihabitans sp.]|nr:glycerophosphodiester phosphodiesterase family protein [Jatrophihabitans sp.]
MSVQQWLGSGIAYIAHRGGDADWPEDTAFAYSEAAAWNPRLALEVSVWPTLDGIWVVSEDGTTGRVFDHDYDISKTRWSTLATLRTRKGGYPMMRLIEDVLDKYGQDRVLFIDDKPSVALNSFFNTLKPYNGQSRFVIKSYWKDAIMPPAAHDHGYKTWGYYYGQDMPSFASTQSRFDLLGLDYAAPASAFATMKATGKPVIAHVIADQKAAQTVIGYDVAGMMVSGVRQVVPAG